MKVTIVETLAYTIDVKDADEQASVAMAREIYKRGDISLGEMVRCDTEYEINSGTDYDDSVDMTVDKDGNNLELIEEYQ